MHPPIAEAALRQIFLDARTHNQWKTTDVPDSLLRELVDVLKIGPTSANCSPARILFVKSRAAKERLRPHLSEGNRDKTMVAPVCAIIGYDLAFYDYLPKLSPIPTPKAGLRASPSTSKTRLSAMAQCRALTSSSPRVLWGLDCGPMSGFDNAGVDAEFFAGTDVKSNFLCSLGYGDPAGLRPRSPRFAFDEMARVL